LSIPRPPIDPTTMSMVRALSLWAACTSAFSVTTETVMSALSGATMTSALPEVEIVLALSSAAVTVPERDAAIRTMRRARGKTRVATCDFMPCNLS